MRRNLKRKDSNIFGMFSQDQINSLREAFNMLDVDNDTVLTKSDLISISASIGDPFSEEEIEEMIGGRRVTYMMLLTMIGEKLSEIEPENNLIKAFKMFEDEEGKVYENVLRDWLINKGDKMTKDDVDFLLKDVVSNGLVDYVKLTKIMKRGEVLDNVNK